MSLTIALAVLAGAMAAVVVPAAVKNLRSWRARRRRSEPCERCARPAKYVVRARFDDVIEAELEAFGGSAMSAHFCRRHRPAEAQRVGR